MGWSGFVAERLNITRRLRGEQFAEGEILARDLDVGFDVLGQGEQSYRVWAAFV